MQRMATPPTGPRPNSRNRQHTQQRASTRGGIQKRRGGPPRVDVDGDLDMGSASTRGGRGGRGGRGRGESGTQANTNTDRGRDLKRGGPPRGIFADAGLQRAIARGLASSDVNLKDGGRRGVGVNGALKEAAAKGRGRDHLDNLEHISVNGLRQSKAASNPDGGVKDLLAFLERKASGKDTPARDAVRIRKSRHQGDALIISVKKEDAPKFLGLNTFAFAGTQLHIEKHEGPLKHDHNKSEGPSDAAIQTKQLLTDALTRRYDPALKLLNLSALGSDPELIKMGTFDKQSTSSKFFTALMVVCDQKFANAQEKNDAIVSVSLASNELRNVSMVTTLAQTFPDIKNLDLSNNKFENMSALNAWRWRFRHLDHLVLTGNPIEKVEPNYKDDLLRWYPSLRIVNGVQIRSDQEAQELMAKRAAAKQGKTPLPVRPPSFRDEGQIAENFLKQFFPAYDADRTALITNFYDAQSTFSLSINTAAPRDPQQADKVKPQAWENYIKRSRNLSKISHLGPRMSRAYKGPDSIRECWTTLPATRHPDLLAEGQKWLFECHSTPGLPDPTGQSPSGVGGLIVTTHGEFDEVDVSTGQTIIKRSFDRTFILGPGGPMGIRVLNDMVTYRAYGGSEAWIPEDMGEPSQPQPIPSINIQIAPPLAQTTQQPSQPQPPLVPAGFAAEGPGKTPEQVQREIMVVEMSRRTGMTLEYSNMCLEERGFVFDDALAAFESVKANLPPDAFS
ncbi:MAG: nuclear mRNA export, poly(A)+RNA binding protein [Piccolia ochrophora]|nr:MAG: nuclear mRNA export, poly(A)+RNA binding protein [Piccolia ochrophora]